MVNKLKSLKHINVSVDDLKPADYNPRVELKPGDKEFEKIKRSIQEFGYSAPIIVNNDLTVIGGHQRLSVMKTLGYKEIEVAQVDLNKSEEKALNIALNKIIGYWDDEKLADLFQELQDEDYDLNLTGFDEEVEQLFSEDDESVEDLADKENARMNTIKQYNLHLYDPYDVDGLWQMPIIHNDGYVPTRMIGFNYAKTSDAEDATIHFFVDDYQFERLWNTPELYIETLSKFEALLTPDFSLYTNMPLPMKMWNVYRSRLLGNYWQRQGLRVIPTISWCEADTYQFCFDGIPEGSIVAVSTIGVKRQSENFDIWKNGMDAMIELIKPSIVLVYGGEVEYDYPSDIQIKYFSNEVTDRMKNSKKEEEYE